MLRNHYISWRWSLFIPLAGKYENKRCENIKSHLDLLASNIWRFFILKRSYLLVFFVSIFVNLYSDDYGNNLNKLILDNIQNKRIILFPDGDHRSEYNAYLFYSMISEYRKRNPEKKIIIAREMPSDYNYEYVFNLFNEDKLEEMYKYFINVGFDCDVYELSKINEFYDKKYVTFLGLEEDSSVDPFNIANGSLENRARLSFKYVKDRQIIIASNLNRIIEENRDCIIFVFYGAVHLNYHFKTGNKSFYQIKDKKVVDYIVSKKKLGYYEFPYYLNAKNETLMINYKDLFISNNEDNHDNFLLIDSYGHSVKKNNFWTSLFFISESLRSEDLYNILKNVNCENKDLKKSTLESMKLTGKDGRVDIKNAYFNWLNYIKKQFNSKESIETGKLYPYINVFTRITQKNRRLLIGENSIDRIVDITLNDAEIRNLILVSYFGYKNEKEVSIKRLRALTGKDFKKFHDWFEWYYLGE